jgi:hypothetical protein
VCTEFECTRIRCINGVYCVQYNIEGIDRYKYFKIYYESNFLNLIKNGVELSEEEFYKFNEKYEKH